MGDLYLLPAFRYAPDYVRSLMESLPVEEWSYLGSDTARRLGLEKALEGRVEWRSVAEPLAEASRRLRQPFLELIGHLTQLNASPLWWGSALATKNPYTSPLFLQCCFLAIGRDLLLKKRQDGRLLVVESRGLLRRLLALAAEAGVSVRHLASGSNALGRLAGWGWRGLRTWRSAWMEYLTRRAVLRRYGMASLPAFNGPGTVLLFAWVDHRNFTPSGSYSEPHFGELLPRYLRSQGYRLAYLARVLGGFPFAEAVHRLRATGETCFFPEALLTPGDVAGILARCLRYRPALPRPIFLEGLDVTELVREQVDGEVTSLFGSLFYYSLVKRLARSGIAPELFFHTMEGHSWERILCQAARAFLPETELVGCNTGTFSPMLLCIYPAQAETRRLPLPHRIVTNGPMMEKILREAGYPPSAVVAGAALRQQYLWERPPLTERPTRGRVARVLVAGEIGFARSLELVDKALRALAGKPGYEVIVNSHPRANLKAAVAELRERAQAPNVRIATTPVRELLPQVDVLLYTYSGACFDALRYGVPPVFVQAEGWLNMDELERAPECRWVATTPEEIREAVDEIVGLPDATWWRWYRHSQDALAQHMAPSTPKLLDRFLGSRPGMASSAAAGVLSS